VRALVEFSWTSDDDAVLLIANDLYQFGNVASTFFGELLDDWLALKPGLDPLTTKVTILGQQLALSPTGENMEFRFPSIVELTYIGDEEIHTLASKLEEITNGQEIPANLTSNSLPSTFTMSFSDPPLEPSTILYTAKNTTITLEEIATDQEIPAYLASSSLPSTFTTSFSDPPLESSRTLYTVKITETSQTGLVVASIGMAASALIVALLILLWAVGCFDNWKSCKKLRSRFYVHSSTPKSGHEVITKSTSDSTQDGTTGIVVNEMKVLSPEGSVETRAVLEHVEEAMAPDEGGFEVSNTQVEAGLDEMEAQSCADSEASKSLPIITCMTDAKWTSDESVYGNGNVEAVLETYLDEEFDEENLRPGQRATDGAPIRRIFGSKRKKNRMRMLSPSMNMADSFSLLPFGSGETEALSPRDQATVVTDFSEFSKGRLSVVSSASRTNNTVGQSNVAVPTTESILADLLVCQCKEGPAASGVDESTIYTDGTGTFSSSVVRSNETSGL
jgi:hypothetical protein